MSDITDEFIDVEQAAQALRCSPYTIRERARQNALKGVKFGDDWVFPRRLFVATVESMAMESAAPAPEPKSVATPGRLLLPLRYFRQAQP